MPRRNNGQCRIMRWTYLAGNGAYVTIKEFASMLTLKSVIVRQTS